MTDFKWNENNLELEIVDPQHPTYVPLSGNKCWALIPTNLDWYCNMFNTPDYCRILKRIGIYFKIGKYEDSLTKIIKNLKTFYGSNYLRLTGDAADAQLEITVFPDLDESHIYYKVFVENMSDLPENISIIFSFDFEFHKMEGVGYGFTEDAEGNETIPREILLLKSSI